MTRSRKKGKEWRVDRAQERAEKATKRTPQEQLKRLDEMLGEGQGAVKERAKLARQIAEEKNARSK